MIKEIEVAVRELLVDYGYYYEGGTLDIVLFARSHGFSVCLGNLPYKYEYGLIIRPDHGDGYGEKKIILNQAESIPRKRIFIARALAQAFLPSLNFKKQKLFLRKQEDDESIDNYFAAALLMPEESFRSNFQRLKRKRLEQDDLCVNLAALYRVPMKSVRYRIKELELENSCLTSCGF